MKTLQEASEPTQYPPFWNEEWLKRAIEELDTRQMTPEERFQFARITAINAEAVLAEKQLIETTEVRKEGEVKKTIIINSLRKGLPPELIAEINEVSLEVVLTIQSQL